jgi:hypothetical protein
MSVSHACVTMVTSADDEPPGLLEVLGREIGAETNEIPELAPCIRDLDLAGTVITLDALHTQRDTARLIAGDKGGHYLMIVKADQPGLLEQVPPRSPAPTPSSRTRPGPRTARATAAV